MAPRGKPQGAACWTCGEARRDLLLCHGSLVPPRLLRPLLKPGLNVKAGMYKGYRLLQVGKAMQALPIPMPTGKPAAPWVAIRRNT